MLSSLLLLYGRPLQAEGIPELKPANDEVRLIINRSSDTGGGRTNFAGWGNSDPFSRLYIHVVDPSSEYIYIGLGLSDLDEVRTNDLNPEFDGEAIRYRLIAPNGTIVVDEVILLDDLNITGANDNVKFNNAQNGPFEITGTGYTAGGALTITPSEFSNAGVGGLSGDYYIEFTEALDDGTPINPDDGDPSDGAWDGFELEFFDFTVADNNDQEKKGRAWSYRWELTTTSPDLPFNGAFYVCDEDEASAAPNDAFITKIDFDGVGFKPYAFNVIFNSTGLDDTGNPVVDRQSLEGNDPLGTPKHRTFLNDPVHFPTAQFGSPTVDVMLERCGPIGPFAYCFLVTAEKPGSQIDILLDLNGTPGYQPGTADVVLSKQVGNGDQNTDMCIPWDGLDGNGDEVDPADLDDSTVLPSYMEGIFHFPIFDAEANDMSFGVSYIRPMPSGASDIALKWDDSQVSKNINGGSGSCEQVNLDGCPVGSASCDRCWVFDYGDRTTLNTFWTSLTVPLGFTINSTGYYTCDITGENALCPGESTTLTADLTLLPNGASAPSPVSYNWTGPNGFVASGPSIDITDFDPATDGGQYTVTVDFGAECSTTCSTVLRLSDNCQADVSVTKLVNDNTPDIGQTINFTIVLANDGPVEATNVTIQDEVPDGYDMINVTDGIGVYNPGDRTITWTVASLPATPGSNTLNFTYTARVVEAANYTNIVQVTASDQEDVDSDPDKDETEDEDGDGDPFDDDEDFQVICPNSTIAITPGPLSVCVGDQPTLNVLSTSGGAGNCTVQWWASDDNISFTFTGVTGNSITLSNTLDEGTYYYKARYICDGEFCGVSESNVTAVSVVPEVSLTVENIIMGVDYATSEICENFDVLMDVEICNPTALAVSNLTAVVDLESQSNGIFAGNVQILGLVDGDEVTPSNIFNPDFDGDSDQNLFKPGAATLPASGCLRVRIRFEVAPEEAFTADLASSAVFVSTVAAGGCTSGTIQDEAELGGCWDSAQNVGANDNIYVTTDKDCKAIITPDMILEGEDSDCGIWNYPLGGFYRIRILYPGESEPRDPVPYAEVCASDFPNGMVIVYVEVVSNDCLPLWGKVTLEDKRDPYFECAPEEVTTIERSYDVQTADGQLSNDNDGQINFSDWSCFQDERGTPDDCAQPYDVLEFYVSKADVYTFEAWEPDGDNDQVNNDDELLLALFQGDFDPDQPCSNIIGQSNAVSEYGVINDEQDPDGRIRIAFPLQPGKKYSLLVAQDDCGDNSDDYRIYALSDQGGEILDDDLGDYFGDPRPLMVERELFCSDVDYILNNSDYTPNPVAKDNCSETETWFVDELSRGGDCRELYITRTWYIRDAAGNYGEPCIQTIRFKRPGLEDVQKPATTVPIECDELGPEWLDENGRPKPEIAGYPFVITAFGVEDLNEALCNVGADYRDISVITVCENTQKIVRQWIILDWCDVGGQWELNNGTEVNWRQIIKTGDFTAPVVTVDDVDPVISTTPFSCAGDLLIADVQVTDNCSASYTVAATVFQVDGNVEMKIYEGTAGDLVRNVPLGSTYRVEYEVADDCGNTAETSYTVTVEDTVEPTAVCDDSIFVTLGGNGIGRLTADDVDEGSYDNCGLNDLYVSRKLASDDIRDAYLQTIYGITFDALEVDAAAEDLDQNVISDIWVMKSNGQEVLRRKGGMWYTWWQNQIWFICQDAAAPVTVELLAEDINGLTNRCWQTVSIEDKSTPVCEAPQNVTDLCTSLPYGFAPEDDAQLENLFGAASGQSDCATVTARQINKTVDWDCNSGTITRYFVAESANGKTSTNDCRQVITILPQHDYEIKFPKDVAVDCAAPDPDTVMYQINGCDLLTVNVTDERFDVSGESCYKIRRTYKVMNWCEYTEGADPVIVSRDHDCDGVTGEEDVYVIRRANGDVFFDRTGDETDASPAAGSRGCSPNNPTGYWEKNAQFGQNVVSSGYWQYTQFIKVEDNTPPEVAIGGDAVFCSLNNETCDAEVSIPFDVSDLCSPAGITVTAFIDGEAVAVSGTNPNFSVSGRYGLGDHELEVRAKDGCGQTQIARQTFSVVDCLAPAPECINGLAAELMPVEPGTDVDGDGDDDSGMVTIKASDFKVNGLDDCTGPVTLSINRLGETPSRDQAELILTCDDPDTLVVEIFAWDSADNPTAVQPDGTIGGPNYDKCITYILVQDNMFGLCDESSPASISGLITNHETVSVEYVDVYLTGGMVNEMQTTMSGAYRFGDLTVGMDYTITPLRDDDHSNGVSTLDVLKVNRHILGTAKLTDPYQLIAADVNQSGKVSALDMIHIRKVILGSYPVFPSTRSWRFIPADYVFPDPDNPWSETFPEVLNYNNVTEQIASGDFVAVKMGDIDGSAQPNSQFAPPRSLAGEFRIKTEDKSMTAGNKYSISFTAEDIQQVNGYQFTLNFDRSAIELVDVQYAQAKAENLGLAFVEDGAVTVSWNREEESLQKSKVENEPLFTLHFQARRDVRLSEALSLNSRYTPAEAYDAADEYLDVDLAFGEDRASIGKFELYQNQPNPWRDKTAIRFHLPAADVATITVYDVQGKVLKQIRGQFDRGFHQIELDKAGLNAAGTGVLYYRLQTKDFSATRKMVVF